MTRYNIAFLDLETTGTDENVDEIVEVGIVVTDPDLDEIDSRSWVVKPSDWPDTRLPAVVAQMHARSGLLDEIGTAGVIAPVDRGVAAFLDEHTLNGKVALAGSGVGHFDSRFIRRHMPETAKRLTYWTLDVGVIRRSLIAAGAGHLVPDQPRKPHRGLDDARLHLAEARVYWKLLATIPEPTTWHVASDEPDA